ncbi:hypothetical protein [Micromonospora fluostatini]|uniref:hypothetical protein n=1 Tax=Micromonospora sp. JCM 30529 TaxID=3421643 RepID=UPI003D17CB7C
MADDPLFAVVVAANVALSVYALWQVARGWRATRRGEARNRLFMAGVTRLLLSAALWMVVFLYTPLSHDLGPATGIVALVAVVALSLLTVLVDRRRRQVARTPHR